MLDAEKDELITYVLRCPEIYEEAISRLHRRDLSLDHEPLRLIVWAAKHFFEAEALLPSDGRFRHRFRLFVKASAERMRHLLALDETVEQAISKGGFIDKAFDIDPGDLSLARGHSLLRDLLYETTVVRPLNEVLHDCSNSKSCPEDIHEIFATLSKRLEDLDNIKSNQLKTIGDDWKEHDARLKPFRKRTMAGLITGLPELDRRTLGLRGIFVLGAKPGAGKTTYGAVQIALGVCTHHEDNEAIVVVLSLDMDRFDLYRRIHCNLGGIPWTALMFGSPERSRLPKSKMSQEHKDCLKRAKKRLKDEQIGSRLTVLDREFLGDDITVHRLRQTLKALKERAGAKRVLLVVDYLQLLPVPEDVAARGDLTADKYRVRMIQQVIESDKTADDPIGDTALVISEARKPPSSKDVWGDSISELMGSARLGYAGDAVILYREMNYKEVQKHYGLLDRKSAEDRQEELKEQGIALVTIILDKGRDGMIRGKWGAEFHFNTSTFKELRLPKYHKLQPGGAMAGGSASGPAGNGSAAPGNGQLPLPPAGYGTSGSKTKTKKKQNSAK